MVRHVSHGQPRQHQVQSLQSFGRWLANTIGYNARDGVAVIGNTATGNAIIGNSIHDNGVLGIDLGADGVTPNGSLGHTGPNNFQNSPVLKSAAGNARTTTVSGTFGSRTFNPSPYQPNTIITLDFYANGSPDRSGNYGGQNYLGSYRVRTDGNGYVAFTTPKDVLAAAPAGVKYVTATATDPGGNTSEFSLGLGVAHHHRARSGPRLHWSTVPTSTSLSGNRSRETVLEAFRRPSLHRYAPACCPQRSGDLHPATRPPPHRQRCSRSTGLMVLPGLWYMAAVRRRARKPTPRARSS